MTNSTIGTLATPATFDNVTWNEAKRQIRFAIRAAGLIVGKNTFRPRRENAGELMISVKGGTVSASKTFVRTAGRRGGSWTNAAITFNTLIEKTGSELSADELAAIVAMG